MFVQMSKKSKIYHRAECRYIKRINKNSLVLIDLNERKNNEFKPCKCCCSLKSIYKKYKPGLNDVFADMDIETEMCNNYINIHTAWYEWRIYLESSTQNLKLYRAEKRGVRTKTWTP